MEQDHIAVSIVIPVYNAQSFLHKCIDSVRLQTLDSIEIILVNDGSTDQSGSLCDDYAAEDPRIRVIHLQNGGPGRARNHGIRFARGKYIGFVDADDYVDHTMFQCLYEKAEQTGSDIVMCGYSTDVMGTIHPVPMDYAPLYSGKQEIRANLLQRYYAGNYTGLYSMCNKLFQRSFVTEHDLKVNESLRRAEDAWFVFDCLKAANTVAYLPQSLYYYYQNSESIMHGVSKGQFEKWVYSRNRLLEENEQLNFELDLDLFYRDFLYKTANYCREMVCQKEISVVKSIFEDPMYIQAITHRRKLPWHVRFLLWLTQNKHFNTAIAVYHIWALGNEVCKKVSG